MCRLRPKPCAQGGWQGWPRASVRAVRACRMWAAARVALRCARVYSWRGQWAAGRLGPSNQSCAPSPACCSSARPRGAAFAADAAPANEAHAARISATIAARRRNILHSGRIARGHLLRWWWSLVGALDALGRCTHGVSVYRARAYLHTFGTGFIRRLKLGSGQESGFSRGR